MEESTVGKQVVFIKYQDIEFNLECQNCHNKHLMGNKDLNFMYYIWLSVFQMKMSSDKSVKIEAKKDSWMMFNSVVAMLDETGIGWEAYGRKVEYRPNKKFPDKKEEIHVCYLRRILK